MQFNKNDIETLLDLKGGFQTITVLETGKLTIDVKKENNEKRSMTIHFPSPEDANDWVNQFFTEFASVGDGKTVQ